MRLITAKARLTTSSSICVCARPGRLQIAPRPLRSPSNLVSTTWPFSLLAPRLRDPLPDWNGDDGHSERQDHDGGARPEKPRIAILRVAILWGIRVKGAVMHTENTVATVGIAFQAGARTEQRCCDPSKA